jgi:hypothetical protein
MLNKLAERREKEKDFEINIMWVSCSTRLPLHFPGR